MAAFSAKAQFKVTNDSLYAYGYAGTSSSSFVDLEAETHIYNLSFNAEVIKWVRTTNQLPSSEWTSAVCDIVACRGSDVDTGSFVFNPGDSGILFFHFYTKNVNASGKMVVRFSRAANPLDYVDVVTFATAWKPVGINPVNTAVTSIAPNPAKNTVVFTNTLIASGQIEIYNAMGQIVLSMDYTNGMQLDIQNLSSGIYTLKISDDLNTSISKIIKE